MDKKNVPTAAAVHRSTVSGQSASGPLPPGNSGFTLIELVVVVSIIAIVAGLLVAGFGRSAVDERAETATLFEMNELRTALLNYRRDIGEWPAAGERASPADVGFLFAPTASLGAAGLDSWNPTYQRGWRGPYIQRSDRAIVDLGDDIDFAGDGNPALVGTAEVPSVTALPDAYEHFPENSDGNWLPRVDCAAPDTASCVFEWRSSGTRLARHGRPYFLFDLDDNNRARIVSLGPNGIYDCDATCGNCDSAGDDHVLCLF